MHVKRHPYLLATDFFTFTNKGPQNLHLCERREVDEFKTLQLVSRPCTGALNSSCFFIGEAITYHFSNSNSSVHYSELLTKTISATGGQPVKDQKPYFLFCYRKESHYSHEHTRCLCCCPKKKFFTWNKFQIFPISEKIMVFSKN